MPCLDVVIAQASSQNHLIWPKPQSIFSCKPLSTLSTPTYDKRLLSKSKTIHLPERLNAPQSNKLIIKAVATLEPKCLLHEKDGHNSFHSSRLDANLDPSTVQADSEELEEREILRRKRISKANKGNVPWNKGRKHSAETLQRIRERTRLAMQNPKVKMKLINLGHAQSKETRIKIGVGVRLGWQKRREKQMMQETCYFEWQNLIAEASRRGYAGEEELHWDSYKILSAKLAHEWVEIVESRKSMQRPKSSKRAPKSLEQRRKIAEAIAAKWADPAYRDRVCSGLARYHGTPTGVERKSKRKTTSGTQSNKRATKKKSGDTKKTPKSDTIRSIQQLSLPRSKTPLYKDPLASSKLQMIKDMRAQRAAADIKKTEAIERARLLIFEAESAANALEVAARKCPIAQAPLMEARKLIAEAIQSIESIDATHVVSNKYDKDSSATPAGLTSHVEKIINVDTASSNQDELRRVNGNKLVASSKDEDLNFSNLTFHDILIGEKEFLPANSIRYDLPQFNWQSPLNQSSAAGQFCQLELDGITIPEKNPQHNVPEVEHLKEERPKLVTRNKKWIRGRLVEVTEEG